MWWSSGHGAHAVRGPIPTVPLCFAQAAFAQPLLHSSRQSHQCLTVACRRQGWYDATLRSIEPERDRALVDFARPYASYGPAMKRATRMRLRP